MKCCGISKADNKATSFPGSSDYKAFLRAFTLIYQKKYLSWKLYLHREYGQSWLVSVRVKNWNLDPRNKLHTIPRFPVGSFAFHVGDHLRLGIIRSPSWGSSLVWGSFAVLYTPPWDLKNITTYLKGQPRKEYWKKQAYTGMHSPIS